MMRVRTKIICTIGPAVNSLEKIEELIREGMNVARLNFSHGTHEQHAETIALLKQARKQLKKPLAICLDTKGPEVRIGEVIEGLIEVYPGDRILLTRKDSKMSKNRFALPIHPVTVLDEVSRNERVLFDDGYLSSRVIECSDEGVWVEMQNGGIIRSGKGVNLPDTSLNLPAMTEKDIEDIKFGCKQGVDVIAASFIRTAEDLLAIKRLMHDVCGANTLVFAKIENREGIDHFDDILKVADGIMIARGDLGVELPLSQVPGYQKMMIRKCYLAGKPSVTATQMLESMIQNPRPTRAEASDVANAIYDSTSAVMLSGETAIGEYPIEAVKVMRKIIREAEQDFNYEKFFYHHHEISYHDVLSSVTLASVKTAYSASAKAVFTFTSKGNTARALSRLRPQMPIIALTPNEKSYHQLALNWGVHSFFSKEYQNFEEALEVASHVALEEELVQYGDLIVATAGSPFGIVGTTNMMLVENIGDVLVRGYIGYGKPVYGKVSFALYPGSESKYGARKRIAVIKECLEEDMSYLKEVSGIILQNSGEDKKSEQRVKLVSETYDIPAIVRAEQASDLLQEGQLVTLDPSKKRVYKGVVLDRP